MTSDSRNVRPFDDRSPFRRRMAISAGLTDWALASRRYHRLFHDVYVSSDVPLTPAVWAAAVILRSPAGCHISHITSALLWGGAVPEDPDLHVSFTAGRLQVAGVRAHKAAARAAVTSLNGIPLSTPEQSFVESARLLPLVDLVALGDSLIHAGRTSVRKLVAAADAWVGHGAHAARHAASLVRAGVDSAMETRVRLLIVLAGLPEPVVDHRIHAADGTLVMRFDMSYPEYRLIIEYDGRQHAQSDRQWARDIARREDIDHRRWRIVVLRAADIYVTPEDTLVRLVQAMVDCGMPVPPLRGEQWRRHFPGRRAVG